MKSKNVTTEIRMNIESSKMLTGGRRKVWERGRAF